MAEEEIDDLIRVKRRTLSGKRTKRLQPLVRQLPYPSPRQDFCLKLRCRRKCFQDGTAQVAGSLK